jgi:hypothetical protein
MLTVYRSGVPVSSPTTISSLSAVTTDPEEKEGSLLPPPDTAIGIGLMSLFASPEPDCASTGYVQ